MFIPRRHIHGMTLSEFMKQSGLTDAKMAAKVGVTQPHISRLRRGDRRASPELAKELERETGIPAAQFIFGESAA